MTKYDKETCPYRHSHKWRLNVGGKCGEDDAFLTANKHCEVCQNPEECIRTTFHEQEPNKDFSNYNIYINLKPEAEVIKQQPQPEQENNQEVQEEAQAAQ